MYDSLVQHSVRRWLLGSRPAPLGRQIRKIPPRRFPITPRLEALEDRLTPATFNVTPTGAGLSSLAGAVAQANQDTSPDTIVLAPGQYNLTGQLAVTTPNALILQGTASSPGATVIDAGQADERILYVTGSGSITLQDLTIQHGRAFGDGSGSAVLDAEGGALLAIGGGNVTLSNVVVQSNTAQAASGANAFGGGIFVQGGSLDIRDSVIRNNNANGGNGLLSRTGGSAEGGGVYLDSGVNPNASLTLINSTVSGNRAQGGNGATGPNNGDAGNAVGGGIAAGSAANVTILGSTLSDNLAIGGTSGNATDHGGFAEGGGATLGGADTIINSTLAHNFAYYGGGAYNGVTPASGGGLYFPSHSTASLVNVTVALNTADDLDSGSAAPNLGGGISNEGGTVTLLNTIVADNHGAVFGLDYYGNVQSDGHNLIGDGADSTGFSAARGDQAGNSVSPIVPLLGPLQNNGGPTPTLALLPGSPAIAAGDASAVSATGPNDQRGPGYNRVVNGTIDIGAFQVQSTSTPPPAGDGKGSIGGSGSGGGGGSGSSGGSGGGSTSGSSGGSGGGGTSGSGGGGGSSSGTSGSGGGGSSSVAPVGSLMLFGFGFGTGGQLDLLELDQKGQVFSLAFSLANFENPSAAGARLANTNLILQDAALTEAGGFPALLGSLVGSNHQSMLLMTVPIQLMPSAALADLLKAWQAAGV